MTRCSCSVYANEPSRSCKMHGFGYPVLPFTAERFRNLMERWAYEEMTLMPPLVARLLRPKATKGGQP